MPKPTSSPSGVDPHGIRPPHADPDAAPRPIVALAETIEAGTGTMHAHRRHQLIYASEGVVTVVTQAGRWVVPAHRAVWVPGGTPHRVDAHGPYRLCTLYVSTRLQAPGRTLPGDCRVVVVTPLLRELLLAAAQLGFDYPAHGAARRLMDAAVDQIGPLQVAALALPMPLDRRSARVAEALLADCADARTLDQWGETVGASARTLERLFRDELGMSFAAWRSQLRLLSAITLLAQRHSVTQVALAVGYEDVSSFITMFRRALGTTPARYLAGG